MRAVRRAPGMESGFWRRLTRLYWSIPARRARPASVAFNAFKTLVQSLSMWFVFLAAGPFLVWNVESRLLALDWPLRRFGAWPLVSVGLFLVGWIVAWASAWCLIRWGDGTPLPLDATNRLVVRGPYRVVRNPMAFASLLQGAAIGVGLGSPLVVAYVLAGALMWNFGARPWEERDMETRFGDEFRAYKAQVRCWIPRLKPYRQEEGSS